jgi:elongation factor Ts
MSEVSAALVKELRSKSGAGMMDCKKALAETNGDIEAASDWLRKKGLAAAAKKAHRVAAEGLVAVALRDGAAAVVEVNAETDFVARSPEFQKMARAIAQVALDVGPDIAAIGAAKMPGGGRTVKDEIVHAIATIGENMSLRRAALLKASPGVVVAYVHNAVADGMGRIGVLVGLRSTGDKAQLQAFGKQIAMHVAAASPLAVATKDLDAAVVERERAILAEQVKESGKPADIMAKMVEGRMRKFHQEVVLLEQTFVIDGETPVNKAIAAASKTVGAPVEITGFVRFALGEGIAKQADDFAAEVAKLVG